MGETAPEISAPAKPTPAPAAKPAKKADVVKLGPAIKATKKAAKPSGNKTDLIIASLKAHPDWTRVQHAEKAGCTVGRVGEVIRAGGVNYTAEKHAANVGKKGDLEAQLAKAEERVASLKAAIKAAKKSVNNKEET